MATYRQPRIYNYTRADALRDTADLGMQLAFNLLSREAAAKERKEAKSLTLLSEQYREVSNALNRIEGEYATSKRLYEATLGKVSPIDRTEGSESFTGDLEQYYVNRIDSGRSLKGRLENQMEQHYSEMADIARLQTGLATAVTPEAGIPGVYDPADFATKRLQEIFNIDPTLIDKYRTKQPEKIPAVIRSLEQLRLKAVQEDMGLTQEDLKTIQKDQMTNISNRIAHSHILQDMDAIAQSDLSEDDKREQILRLGSDLGAPLSLIVDPANEPSKSDSKKVQKEKRDKQYTKAIYLHNTFNSFKAKTGHKDIVGLGNFVNSLSHKAEVEIEPENRPAFKTLIKEYYNIDLDAKEEFMLPGYSLKEGTAAKKTPLKPIFHHSAEEVVAFMWERSGLPRNEFMADKETMKEIKRVYASLYPDMTEEVMDKRIADAFELLVGTEPEDTKVGV